MFSVLRKVDKPNLAYLEQKLEKVNIPEQRLSILLDLVFHYNYKNILKAENFLKETATLLRHSTDKETLLPYYLHYANFENQSYNYTLAKEYFQNCLEIIEEFGNITQLIEANIDYIGTLINLDQLSEAQVLIDKTQKYLLTFPNKALEFRLKCRQGYLGLNQHQHEQALRFLLEAEEILNHIETTITVKDIYFLTLVYSGMGIIYEIIDDKAKSIRAYQRAVDFCEAESINTRISYHYNNLGKMFITIEDYESAEAYFKKALKINDDASKYSRAGALANLGYCYYFKENFEEALKYYSAAEKLYRFRDGEDRSNIATIASLKAKVYLAQGKSKKAEKQLSEAYNSLSDSKDLKLLISITQDIATFYYDTGDYRNAYIYQKQHSDYAQSYYEAHLKSNLAELEARYRSEKRENEIQLLRLEATLLQSKALRAQMNPHFIFNALNSIQHYISIDESETATRYLAQFARLMRQSLENSEKENISLEEDIDFLHNYLTLNQKLRFGENLKFEITVDEDIEEDIMNVPAMIVQPYIENAIEHGLRPNKGGMIKIHYTLFDENVIRCTIEDNGVGMAKSRENQEKNPDHKSHKSMGTAITEKRLELLHTELQLQTYVTITDLTDAITQESHGTRVEVLIPVIDVSVQKLPELMMK